MLMLPFDWLFPASRRVAEQFGEPLCRACRYAHHPGPQGRAPDGGRGDVALADRGQGCRTGSSTATRLAAGGPGRRNANERSHRIRADQPSPSRPTPPLCCGSRRGRRTRSRPPETSTHATLGQTRSKAARPCRWLPRTRAPSKRPIPRHAESDHARRAFGPPRSAGLILADRPCAAPSLGIDLSTSGSAAFRVYGVADQWTNVCRGSVDGGHTRPAPLAELGSYGSRARLRRAARRAHAASGRSPPRPLSVVFPESQRHCLRRGPHDSGMTGRIGRLSRWWVRVRLPACRSAQSGPIRSHQRGQGRSSSGALHLAPSAAS